MPLTREQLSEKRIEYLLMHVGMIARGKSGIAPDVIAKRAQEDDAKIVACINGTHAWIDVTAHSGPRYLCGTCGFETSKLLQQMAGR